MDKDLEPETHMAVVQSESNEHCSQDVSVPSNDSGAHSFTISNITNGLSDTDSHHFDISVSMVDERCHSEEESPLKSFSCVDYLEIMHDEMLNPESNHSEPDGQEDGLDLVCKQSECEFSTTDMDAYLKHEYEHIDGKVYECDVCKMKFNLFASMRNHRMSHLSHRPYKCRLCSKEFYRKDILVEHLVKQHSKQRPYRCPFCPKHFKLRPQLKLHLSNEHSAAMLIKTCKLCGFKAASPTAFRSHFAICYMKRSRGAPEASACNTSQVNLVTSEANAIDLGAVSQNFSFVPSYAPYALVANDTTHCLPGPSDVTQVVSLHTTSAGCSVGNKSDQCASNHHNATTPPRVSSLASSTTALSPPRRSRDDFPQNLVIRTIVKSEPSELRDDDQQNGSALPTSTMDLSSGSIVETNYNSNEATCCRTPPEVPFKVKATSSWREERSCQNAHSRDCYTISKVRCNNTTRETICRCNLSSRSCANWNKRERLSDGASGNESTQTESQPLRKRSCNDKATTTDASSEMPSRCANPAHYPRRNSHAATVGDCCNDSKANIMVGKVENSSYTCPFCNIIFPDQTLYFLHRSLHSDSHPWKCNLCGKDFKDKYEFNSHIISQSHR